MGKSVSSSAARHAVRLFALALFVAATRFTMIQAAELEPYQWPTKHRDCGNGSSTSVQLFHPDQGEELKVLWRSPGGGLPLVYSYVDAAQRRVQRVISGPFVYEAWTGNLVTVLPFTGNEIVPAIDAATGVMLAFDEDAHRYEAFGLQTLEQLWYIDRTVDADLTMEPKAISVKDRVFCVSSFDSAVASIDVLGNVLGQHSFVEPDGWKPWVERHAIAATEAGDIVSVGVNNATTPGIFAFDLRGIQPLTADLVTDVKSVCADAATGLVFAQYHDATDYQRNLLGAWSIGSAAPAWQEPVLLDHSLPYGSPPSLGSVNGTPAVFVVTFEESLYAVNRGTGAVMYKVDAPSAGWSPAAYAGGLLYLSGMDNRIFVHDANTGQRVHALDADDISGWREASPAVVDVVDTAGQGQGSALYYWATNGDVVALSTRGTDPLPATFQLTVTAVPQQIGTFSQSAITATLVDGKMQPVTGATVNFSCDAGNNQGYLASNAEVTDSNGQAITTFHSEKRLGTITIEAEAAGVGLATTVVSVAKSTVEPPPTEQTGGIKGTVYLNGKPARKLIVTLASMDPNIPPRTTKTNPKGVYTFDEVPFGDYTVSATKDNASDEEAVSVTENNPVQTGVDLHLDP